ncbi:MULTISPECIES: replication-relaxation family protein [unclassified Streptomyces]|uniref:replication-relaxation family protein n=1 Tax=unclassified Streptomyces TaxID=2593676 RepID=UPI00196032BC|nr:MULTISPECIES: replication-relaxation family protein [unclassified Streptomyces]
MITNPMPQRALRGHQPSRPHATTAATSAYAAQLTTRLTDRDRWLVHMLHEHRVLTTHQITAMAWPSERAANLRLLRLYRWRVIDRFQPFVTSGSAPMHYVLDVAGAALLAREHGLEPRELDYQHDRALGIAHSLHLAHTVGTNGFFSALVAHSRPSCGLTAWWSETRCARLFGDIARPDAYGIWQGDTTVEWFLEFDFGTERPDRVAAKLPRYARLAATTGITSPVLFWMPTPQRETQIRHVLAQALTGLDDPGLVPLATINSSRCSGDPAKDRWHPLDPALKRLPLTELPDAWPHLPPVNPVRPSAPHTGAGLPPPSPIPPSPTPRRPRK